MAQMHEYLEDYGFEGMELDWLRDPHILEPGASEADCAMITAWMREVLDAVNCRLPEQHAALMVAKKN